MTPRLVILCIEDEAAVRDAIVRDLEPFGPSVLVETAETVADARDALAETARAGDRLALVLADHLLPGEKGVRFLVELHADPVHGAAKKVLVTGQAGLEDTIEAVNRAGLDRYIAKPWDPEELRAVVRELLTDFVVEHVDDVLPYLQVLDAPRLLDAHRQRAGDR